MVAASIWALVEMGGLGRVGRAAAVRGGCSGVLVCHFGVERVGVCCGGGGDGDAERGLKTLSGAWSVRELEVMLLREMSGLLQRHSEVVFVVSWRGCQAGLGGLIGKDA